MTAGGPAPRSTGRWLGCGARPACLAASRRSRAGQVVGDDRFWRDLNAAQGGAGTQVGSVREADQRGPDSVDSTHRTSTIPSVRSAAVIKILEADGWQLQRVKGSHHQFRHPSKPGLVTVPHPRAEVALPTLRSIYRQAGLPWK